MKSNADITPNLRRYAYFGASLRIAYECTENPTDGETDIEPLYVQVYDYVNGCWTDADLEVLLDCLNSNLKEAIQESYLIVSDELEIIRDTREKKTAFNA